MNDDFSLTLGGPLYQLYLRTRLARPPLELMRRRIVFFPLITWVPLFVLSLLEGNAFGGAEIPFWRDIVTQARFLVAIPLFLLAERMVHERIKPLVDQFLTCKIVAPEDEPKYHKAVASARRMGNSLWFELVLLFVCFAGGHLLWKQSIALDVSTWYAPAEGTSGPRLTWAGMWFAWISMPVFQFLLFRWYYRFFIWARFLWQMSKLRLHLLSTHPDRAGGLGFLAEAPMAFSLLIMGQASVLSGIIAGKIFFSGDSLISFKLEILAMLILQFIVILGPLCLFLRQMEETRRKGILTYGALATHYMDAFDQKWNKNQPGIGGKILGSSDVQSLADMGNSLNVVREMKIFPFGKESILQVAILTLLPVAPLILTMIPLDQLIAKLLKIPF